MGDSLRDTLGKLRAYNEQIAISQIDRLESGLTADEVIEACKKIVRKQKALRQSSGQLLKKYLYPALENISEISDADEAELYTTAQSLSSFETRLDPGLALEIYDALLKLAHEKKSDEKILKYSYWCGITLFFFFSKMHEKRVLDYFLKGASYAGRYDTFEDPETRQYIHRCLGNISMLYYSLEGPEKAREAEEANFSFWNSIIFSGQDPDFPWVNYFLNGLNHRYSYLTEGIHSDPDSVPKAVLREILETALTQKKLYDRNRELFHVFGGTRYDFHLWEAKFLNDLISFDLLIENIDKRKAELDPDDFSSDAMYVRFNSTAHVLFYATKMRRLQERKDEILASTSKEIIGYFLAIPMSASAGDLSLFITMFASDLGDVTDFDGQVDFILRMTICRHIPTYAHSIVVGKIALLLTKYLIEKNPGCFIGCLDIKTTLEVSERAAELCGFAEKSGLCHDIGKHSYIDNPYIQIRKPTDEEYNIIKKHPTAGADLLVRKDKSPLYSGLIDVIAGHHKNYDNAGGYPEEFDIEKSPVRIMIDIVAVADFIEKTTSDISSTNIEVKSLELACEELKAKAGSRYSPLVAAAFEDDDLLKSLKRALELERRDAYYAAYLRSRETGSD